MIDGLASRAGRLLRPSDAFGTEMILKDYVCQHTVMSMAYTDVYCIQQRDLAQLIESGLFPYIRVRLPQGP